MIYINGIKASKKAIKVLEEWIKAKKVIAYGKFTKKGNIAFRTIG